MFRRKSTYVTPKWKKRLLLALEIILYLVGIGLVIQVFFVRDTLDNAFDTQAAERLIITQQMQNENSTIFRNWVANTCDDVCAIQLFYFYVFNITNHEDVLNGEYPHLEELGPFVFNRYEIRKDVEFSDDGTKVNYRYEYEYILNEEETNMSLWNATSWYNHQLYNTNPPTNEPTTQPTTQPTSANETTANFPDFSSMNTRDPEEIAPYPPIYVLNPFMLASFANCKASGGGLVSICNVLNDASTLYLSNYTIQDILAIGMKPSNTFGCDSDLIDNPLCGRVQKYIIDDDVNVTEYTGTGRMQNMRQLISFYGPNQTYAGGINQTSGEFYEWWRDREYFAGNREPKQWPYDTINSNSVLKAWMMDKFRHVDLINDGSTTISDLTLTKFIIDPKEYLSAENNTANAKYYQNGGIRDGLLNLTTTNGANVLQYSSKPHFLDAPFYIGEGEKMGLRSPNRSLDDTFFAIDDKLGTVFELQVSYMASFGIEPCENCGLIRNPFSNLPNIIIPQFYVVVSATAPPAAIEQYKEILALLDTTTQYSIYAGPAATIICFVFAFYLSGRRYCKYKKRKRLTLYMDDDKSYLDEQWDEMAQNDNQEEYNAEDVDHKNGKQGNNDDNKEENNDNGDGDDNEDWDASIGYAKRDTLVDSMMNDSSLDKTLDVYHNPSGLIKMTNKQKWKNKSNDKDNKKQTATSRLLSKISSKKLDTYS